MQFASNIVQKAALGCPLIDGPASRGHSAFMGKAALKPPAKAKKSVLVALGWYVHEIVVGVTKYAREAGWVLDDLPSHHGGVPPVWRGDGILTLISSHTRHKDLIEMVQNSKLPVVDMSDQLPELPLQRVVPDNEAIGRMTAEHFIGRGFGHFAFYTLNLDAPVVRGRLNGFRRRVEESGRAFHLIDLTGEDRKGGSVTGATLPSLAKRLTQLPKPLAAMAQYDREALDIIRAAHLAGLVVPDEVAVVGVDNDPIYCELGPMPLSSVASNREMVGYKAAELLDRMMRGEHVPSKPLRVMPTGLIVRKSSDIIAVNDANVAKAIGYIADHYREPIDVEDVVKASGSSRRSLYLKFAMRVGHSIHREILRQRLQRAKHLLRETDEKLQAVAQETGFEDAGALSKAFRQHLGVSASSFRELQRPKSQG